MSCIAHTAQNKYSSTHEPFETSAACREATDPFVNAESYQEISSNLRSSRDDPGVRVRSIFGAADHAASQE
jgi:hypothetical protein